MSQIIQRRISFSMPYISKALQKKACLFLEEKEIYAGAATKAALEEIKAQVQLRKDVFSMLTSSCTQALELAALAMDLKPEDEVILPSFTYAATGNAFARTGARLVFADIDPFDMNLCPESVSRLITSKTKAIVPIHYGGRAADMKTLQLICRESPGRLLVEDAAHGIGSFWNEQSLGSIGSLGTISFHPTKNITGGGSGGLLLFCPKNLPPGWDAEKLLLALQSTYTQGTNRQAFLEGKASAYTWQILGGAFEPSPYIGAYLMAALPDLKKITEKRASLSRRYGAMLRSLVQEERIRIPQARPEARENGHNFYVLLRSEKERRSLETWLIQREIDARTHYEPLHLSKAGKIYGKAPIPLINTDKFVACLLRLPLHYSLTEEEQDRIIEAIYEWTNQK